MFDTSNSAILHRSLAIEISLIHIGEANEVERNFCECWYTKATAVHHNKAIDYNLHSN